MGTKNMRRDGKYPLYASQRENVLADFDAFCNRQTQRVKAVISLHDAVSNEWKWTKEWVGKEGLQLEEIRK